jgi:hypothetical protein
MEPKVIGTISNNLEIIRGILENRDTEIKRTFHDIITGDDVKSLISSITEKVDDIHSDTVMLNDSMGNVSRVIQRNNDLIQANNNDALVKILNEISVNVAAILKKTGPQLSPENRKDLENLMRETQKDSRMNKVMVMVSLISQLKAISLKDFLLGKRKIKKLEELYDQIGDVVKKNKDEDIKKTREFIDSAVGMMKKLSKIAPLTKLAQIGAKGIDKVLFGKDGKGGLMKTINEIHKNQRTIKKAKKEVEILLSCCGKLLLLSLALSAMVVVGIPAMAGAMVTYGIVWTLVRIEELLKHNSKSIRKGNVSATMLILGMVGMMVGLVVLYEVANEMEWETFGKMAATIGLLTGVTVLMGMLQKPVKKGAESLVIMGIGYLAVSISMFIMYQTVKGADWEEFGMIAATIGMFGALTLLMGIGPIPEYIMAGATALIFMGIGYIGIGISMILMYKSVKGSNWEEFAMIAATIGTFAGLAALCGLPVVAPFIMMGAFVLGILGLSLVVLGGAIYLFGKMVTDDSIEKIATGIPKILDAITSMFKSDKENPSFGDGILGVILGVLRLGGALFAAGALMMIGIALGVFALCLKPWENVKMKAIDNFGRAYNKINKIFKLDEPGEGGAVMQIKNGIVGLITSALRFGKTFFQMGVILLSVFTMGLIKTNIEKWKNYDPKSMKNFEDAYTSIKKIFKIEDPDDSIGGIGGSIANLANNVLGLASAMFQFGKTFFQMGTILMSMFVMDVVREKMNKWSRDYDTKGIANFEACYVKINELLGLDNSQNPSIGGLCSDIFSLICSFFEFGATFFRMGSILLSIWVMDKLCDATKKWKDVDPKSLDNVEACLKKVYKIFGLEDPATSGDKSLGEKIGSGISNLFSLGSALLGCGNSIANMAPILMAVGIIDTLADGLNKINNLKDPIKNVQTIETCINKIKKFYEKNDFDKAEDKLEDCKKMFDEFKDLVELFHDSKKYFDTINSMKDPENTLSIVEKCVTKINDFFKDKSYGKAEDRIDDCEDMFDEYKDLVETISKSKKYFDTINEMKNPLITISTVEQCVTRINDFYKSQDFDDSTKNIKDCKKLMKEFRNVADIFSDINKDLQTFNGKSVQKIYLVSRAVGHIGVFYKKHNFSASLENLRDAEEMMEYFVDMVEYAVDSEEDIVKFEDLSDVIIRILDKWNPEAYEPSMMSINRTVTTMFNMLNKNGNNYRKNVTKTISLFRSLERLEKSWDGKKVATPFKQIINKVNTVKLDRVRALTSMFNSFAQLKQKSIFSGFKDAVDDFTKACIQLVDAINGNTDALNESSDNTQTNETDTKTDTQTTNNGNSKSIRISNIDELAMAIARRIGNGNRNSGGGSSTIDLRINGEGGDMWTIRRY